VYYSCAPAPIVSIPSVIILVLITLPVYSLRFFTLPGCSCFLGLLPCNLLYAFMGCAQDTYGRLTAIFCLSKSQYIVLYQIKFLTLSNKATLPPIRMVNVSHGRRPFAIRTLWLIA
jgi:hypothetical protein